MKSLILLLCFFLCVQYSFCQNSSTTAKTITSSTSTTNKPSSTKPASNKANSTTIAFTSTAAMSTATTSTATTSTATTSTATTSTATTSTATTSTATTSTAIKPNSSMSNAATSRSSATKTTKPLDTSKVETMLASQLKKMSDKELLNWFKKVRKHLLKKGLLKYAPSKTAKVVSTTKPTPSAKDNVPTPTHGTAKAEKVTGSTVTSTNGVSTKKDANLEKGDKGGKGTNGIVPESMKNKTPDSSHFAVVFLVLIALLFGLYALYHNRGKIIAVVVEGRSGAGNRGGRDRYRKLDNNSEDPEARIKNSNEVYVY